LFENESPLGRLYITLKEIGIHSERDLPLREKGVNYVAELAVPLDNKEWQPVTFSQASASSPPQVLHLCPNSEPLQWIKTIQQTLKQHQSRKE